MPRLHASSPYLLAGFLAGAGATHFVVPRFYDRMVPRLLPGPPRAWTVGSGAAEIAVAAAVAAPQTRREGALAAAALLVAVFPANVQMAADATSTAEQVAAYGRLPLQLPLVVWALRVWRDSRRTTG